MLAVSSEQRGLEVLRVHPALQHIELHEHDRFTKLPVAEFWPKYDALVAAEKEASKQKLETLLATHGKKLPDGSIDLDISGQRISDLSLLAGVNLSRLNASNNPCRDLSPLRKMPLRELNLNGTQVADLSELRGMPLRSLIITSPSVADIASLRGLPLERLLCDFTAITDLRPLLDLPKLRSAMIPRAATNIEVLRAVKTLEYIGWEDDWNGESDDTGHSKLTAAEFWARWDRLKAEAKK